MREREENWWESDDPEVQAYIQKVKAEIDNEVRTTDPVARQCRHALFVSQSKGRGRRRKGPKEVELICYRSQCVEYKDGRGLIDEWATEVLGKSVDSEQAEEEFLRRVRDLGRS